MNDAILLSIDRVRFLYPESKRMKIYGIGIAADSSGRLIVSEMPSSVHLVHRPHSNRPAVWDFPYSGFTIYQKTGGIPDIVTFHFLIIQDRSRKRRVGDILSLITRDENGKGLLTTAAGAAKGIGLAPISVDSAIQLLRPVIGVIEQTLRNTRDRVLQTISGSQYFDDTKRLQHEISDTVTTSDTHMEVEMDFLLFDGLSDEDIPADPSGAQIVVNEDGSLDVET